MQAAKLLSQFTTQACSAGSLSAVLTNQTRNHAGSTCYCLFVLAHVQTPVQALGSAERCSSSRTRQMAGLQVLTGALRGVLAAERAAGSGFATAVRGFATSMDDKKITVEVVAIQARLLRALQTLSAEARSVRACIRLCQWHRCLSHLQAEFKHKESSCSSRTHCRCPFRLLPTRPTE
jgi:hypothetical protein